MEGEDFILNKIFNLVVQCAYLLSEVIRDSQLGEPL